MSTSAPSRSARRWQAIRQLPGRVPLHTKLISALLALVIIALAVISVVSLAEFRGYLQDRADAQLHDLSRQAGQSISGVGIHNLTFSFSGYVAELRDASGQPVPNWGIYASRGLPPPAVPTSQSWLSANKGQVVTVPASSGPDTWRVLTRPVTFQQVDNGFPVGPAQSGTLIVGVDLGRLDQTVSWLAKVDLVVSLIVVAALVVVGVAMVRASLRPLTEIEGTAAAIAAGDLSRRVPERDPRTEVGRLGRALNTMLAQIESAFHARAHSEAAARRSEERMRQFVADASHELRTPLTAIRGYAEYYRQRGGVANGAVANGSHAADERGHPALGGAAEVPPPDSGTGAPLGGATTLGETRQLTNVDMDRIMERVEQESSRMGGLVEDMLVLARLDEQRPIERRPVDLLTLAADAVQDARMIAPGRKVDLTVGTGAAFLVLGDEARLRQVIGNLMNNALTHTPDGTPITVRILAGYQDAAPGVPSVILEVVDQGPGLTREQAERVFERFYRADQARARRTGGAGLGLAIVSALITAHGGTVGVNTSPGHGATFWITLPLDPEATEQPDAAPAA